MLEQCFALDLRVEIEFEHMSKLNERSELKIPIFRKNERLILSTFPFIDFIK
jgi:hypothetical protein